MGELPKYRTFFFVEGIVFIILGILAMALPQVTTLAVELFIGWILLIGGLVQLVRSFTSKEIPGFWPSFIAACLSIVVGLLLIAYPIQGIISLTLLLTLFFLADGLSKLVLGFQYRSFGRAGWIIFSGIISLALAFIIWSGWPGTAVWVIGLMVGINMLFFGTSLFFLGWAAKQN